MKLSNSQYDYLMRQYDAKQSRTMQGMQSRLEEIITLCPEYKELCDKAAQLNADSVRSAIFGDTSQRQSLSKKLDEISMEKELLLKGLGFPSNYLEPVYECPKCKDTGLINGNKCICFTQAAIDLLYNQSNIKKILLLENFSNFNYDWYSESNIDNATGTSAYDNILKIRRELDIFLDAFPSGDNILFYGDTGVGKTFLTHCIAKELLDKGHSVLYLSAIELFELFSKYTFDNDLETDYRQSLSQILDCELLIIDDLGTEVSNTFTNSRLFYCINERALSGLSTIISTNLGLSEIRNIYTERIFSRLSTSYRIYKIFGDDIRLKKVTQ